MRISKHIVPITLALLIAGLVSTTVPAAGAATIDFLDVDANKDGKVSAEEVAYIDELRASFGALDVNHDQTLTPTEYSHWRRAAGNGSPLHKPNSH